MTREIDKFVLDLELDTLYIKSLLSNNSTILNGMSLQSPAFTYNSLVQICS